MNCNNVYKRKTYRYLSFSHLCKLDKELTFEHIPPKVSYNKNHIIDIGLFNHPTYIMRLTWILEKEKNLKKHM